MRKLTEDIGTILVFVLSIFILFPINLHAQSDGVLFWNKMENDSGNKLISEIGPDLNLANTNWSYRSAMFNSGWDNNHEDSYAYAKSTDVIASSQMGALAFWWVPDDDGDTTLYGSGSDKKASVFFSNGATNYPTNNRYQFEFWYCHLYDPPTFQISLNKRSASGINNLVQMYCDDSPYTGEWKAGDKVHVAFAWHNEPVILGEYIAALWVDGQLVHGWTEPNDGSLEGWETTNPTQPFSEILRIGDSIYPYSTDEQLRGSVDNIIFWDYAKSDYSDRFIESPLAVQVPVDIKPQDCPNPLNLKSKGVLPLAVLGTEDFDATTINPLSVRLSREGIEEDVAPIRSDHEDVATPFEGEPCECHDLNGDGYLDLTMKFKTQALVEKLNLSEFVGQTIPLNLSGNLDEDDGGTPITGEDCVLVLEGY